MASRREPRRLEDIERELTRFVRRSRATSTAMAAEVHPELDVASYVVLITIRDLSESRPGGVRAADVGEALRLHKSTMSRNITVLENLGLLERIPSPDDARARILRTTPTGDSSLTAAIQARRKRMAETLSRWSAADVRELARLLGQLNDDLA